ncbi:type II toxin-antitoxin system Phd/YefM family antitoxin [Pseudanabaena biceps]|nr:type II toxin-antitoxin system Phd/YefM family antitoxin [Pseudanabaena biceps]
MKKKLRISLSKEPPKEAVPIKSSTYQQLLNTIEELETIIGIRKGLKDLAQGHARPLNQFVEEMQKKHGISS